jgi:hypothetical protein
MAWLLGVLALCLKRFLKKPEEDALKKPPFKKSPSLFLIFVVQSLEKIKKLS